MKIEQLKLIIPTVRNGVLLNHNSPSCTVIEKSKFNPTLCMSVGLKKKVSDRVVSF